MYKTILVLAVLSQLGFVTPNLPVNDGRKTIPIVEYPSVAKLEELPMPPGLPVKPIKVAGGCDTIRTKLSNLGVSGTELEAAIGLAMRESTCNEFAKNKSSSACGAFQSLPCGKWGAMGTTEYYVNFIAYCSHRYGDISKALAYQRSHGWY